MGMPKIKTEPDASLLFSQDASHNQAQAQANAAQSQSQSQPQSQSQSQPQSQTQSQPQTGRKSVGKKTVGKPKGSKSKRNTVAKMMKRQGLCNFCLPIHRVLKQIHPDLTISKMSMSILNSMAIDMFDQIGKECRDLANYDRKKTLNARDMQTAVRLVLPGELSKHAVSEGTKAVTKYTAYINRK